MNEEKTDIATKKGTGRERQRENERKKKKERKKEKRCGGETDKQTHRNNEIPKEKYKSEIKIRPGQDIAEGLNRFLQSNTDSGDI